MRRICLCTKEKVLFFSKIQETRKSPLYEEIKERGEVEGRESFGEILQTKNKIL